MRTKPIPICGEHNVRKEWRTTTFEYSDELITTVRELIEIAKRAREWRSVLTEYVVSVSPQQPVARRAHS